ncbi:hypothetical protein CDAR_573631 [Caerostris darwini]|uniref:Uncharacterized protein n=1 Tax=Caerostris darwini TaxID=1538125 RepID=A0AAV4T5P8_9ARAC|nr:hypothetical protein CDAR_573631 [Caerostris darwini]
MDSFLSAGDVTSTWSISFSVLGVDGQLCVYFQNFPYLLACGKERWVRLLQQRLEGDGRQGQSFTPGLMPVKYRIFTQKMCPRGFQYSTLRPGVFLLKSSSDIRHWGCPLLCGARGVVVSFQPWHCGVRPPCTYFGIFLWPTKSWVCWTFHLVSERQFW